MRPTTIFVILFSSQLVTSAAVNRSRDASQSETILDSRNEATSESDQSNKAPREPGEELGARAGTPFQPQVSCIACMTTCLAAKGFANWGWRTHPLKKSALGTWGECGFGCGGSGKCFTSWVDDKTKEVHTSETGQMNNYMQDNGWWEN